MIALILLLAQTPSAFALHLPDYQTAAKAALPDVPLVCWAGCEPIPMAGIQAAWEPSKSSCVWVCMLTPAGKVAYYTLPATASEADIRRKIADLRGHLRPAQVGPDRSGYRIPAAPARFSGNC